MKALALEIRDEATCILVLAVDMNPEGDDVVRKMLRHCGYPCDGRPNIIVTNLDGSGQATNDPYSWVTRARTIPEAHNYIIDHWTELRNGDVIDVEFILGETPTKKVSEIQ